MYSTSSECLGYPHALFRAHRDIRITNQERMHINNLLLDCLYEKGITDLQVRGILDYHSVLEMKQGRRLM